MTDRGLMGGNAAAFRPDAPLTQRALADLVTELTELPPLEPAAPAAPRRSLSSTRRSSVGSTSRTTRAGSTSSPRDRRQASWPVRERGRRAAHRPPQEPRSPLRRARAPPRRRRDSRRGRVFGRADPPLLGLEVDAVEEASLEFALPVYSQWQRRILQTAFNLIGYPYVWGGTSSAEQSLFGVSSRGGFDCSGFAWRVYKLHSYSGGKELASTLRGRTAAQMAGEVPKTRRIAFANLQPGDLLFFGRGGRRARAAASTTWGSTRGAAG